MGAGRVLVSSRLSVSTKDLQQSSSRLELQQASRIFKTMYLRLQECLLPQSAFALCVKWAYLKCLFEGSLLAVELHLPAVLLYLVTWRNSV